MLRWKKLRYNPQETFSRTTRAVMSSTTADNPSQRFLAEWARRDAAPWGSHEPPRHRDAYPCHMREGGRGGGWRGVLDTGHKAGNVSGLKYNTIGIPPPSGVSGLGGGRRPKPFLFCGTPYFAISGQPCPTRRKKYRYNCSL